MGIRSTARKSLEYQVIDLKDFWTSSSWLGLHETRRLVGRVVQNLNRSNCPDETERESIRQIKV